MTTAGPGTLSVLSWSRETPEGDIPYLLVCPLGDGPGGPEAASAAVEQLLRKAGLSPEDGLVNAAARPRLPISLLIVPNAAVLTMLQANSQFVPSPAWPAAVEKRGVAYLILATRVWPKDAELGDPQAPAAFVNDEETLSSAAHVLLPARKLRT
ncbi:DUF5949 family protein [Streptomyces sp. HMX87]|uniref:DUF5949 family protein n=1 Tax=Streptomyces sp. HMX87 TaxID=3390849 RepID=UPI003A87A10A